MHDATLTRLRSPPETPRVLELPMNVSRTETSPSSRMMLSTRSTFCSIGTVLGSRSCAVNIRDSNTVGSAKRASSCSTYADRMLMSRPPPPPALEPEAEALCTIGTPFKRMEPLKAAPLDSGTRPARAFSKDVLPLPEGPMMAANCPRHHGGCVRARTRRTVCRHHGALGERQDVLAECSGGTGSAVQGCGVEWLHSLERCAHGAKRLRLRLECRRRRRPGH